MARITKINALEILDSRGNPTIQVMVTFASGARGVAIVPSGPPRGSAKRWKCATTTFLDTRGRSCGVRFGM
jgi:enolase